MRDTTPLDIAARRPPRRVLSTPMSTILLAIGFGLCGGYLDVVLILLKKCFWNSEGYFRTARDFPWTVPLGHATLMLVPGLVLAFLNRIRPIPVSLRTESRLFATLAIWSALLRLPMYGACSLLLAAGSGRVIGDTVAARGLRPRQAGSIFAALFGVLVILTAISSGWQTIRENRTIAGLPPSPPAARNVVLIVWDTVRAYNVGLYGYMRDTTPNLERWARQGVVYKNALAPAPWTFPSHSSFFTGQWPFKLNTQWKSKLDSPDPTLAEYLTTRGYQTAGFAANTNCCSYETGLDRGFAHYADYALTPRSILTRTIAGSWILDTVISLENMLDLENFYDKKWIKLQSSGAREINDAFLQWLGRRRPDRPFFAFLNYFDAHEPYIPPPGYESRFGIRPRTAADYQFLIDFIGTNKDSLSDRDFAMARDCYDDCVAFLDEQLGILLDALQRQGLLENTDVIITSDHGEGFGEHGVVGHSYSVYLDEIGVPLVILSSAAPAGRVVDSPVSLRDLPATVVDLLGLSGSSPFPGRSLAAYWKLAPGAEVPPGFTSPALSEQANASTLQIQPGHDRENPWLRMSLVASGYHYMRDGMGAEALHNLRIDPFERVNLLSPNAGEEQAKVFRRKLLDALTDSPGSIEAEKAYLTTYRSWLEELLQGNSSQPVTGGD